MTPRAFAIVAVIAAASSAVAFACSSESFQTTDGGVDASTNDVAPGDAAQADAPASDGGVDARGCAAHPGALFCDDFDSVIAPDQNWGVSSANVATYAFDDAAVSPPHGLRIEVPTGSDAGFNPGLEHDGLAQPGSRVRLSLDIDPTAAPTYSELASMAFTNGAAFYQLVLVVFQRPGTTEILIEEDDSPSAGPQISMVATAQPLFTGGYHHFEVDVDLTAPTVTMRLDGIAATQALAHVNQSAVGAGGTFGVTLFGFARDTTRGGRVLFDDVYVERR